MAKAHGKMAKSPGFRRQGGGGGAFATASRMDAAKLAGTCSGCVRWMSWGAGWQAAKTGGLYGKIDVKHWEKPLEKLENRLERLEHHLK